MASDLVTISSSALPSAARVVAFRGTEALSRPYQVEIFLSLTRQPGEEVDLADAVGAKATLTLDRASDRIPPFYFAGVLATVEMLHAADNGLLLRVVLVPRLWQLSLSRHSRIFTNMSIPDIIKSVLDENGVTDVELRLGSYTKEEHVCQYRESDLDFISRWMERHGIFYFFEHEQSGEKLVLCDATTYNEDVIGAPVRYFPQMGQDGSAGPSFRSFTSRHSTLPASVHLRDYDYVKPNLALAGSADIAPNGAGEISLYGERFFSPAAGESLAKVRAEEHLARQVVYHAVGTRLHLRAGYKFELEDHPFASFNTEYLAIEVRHYANQSAGHSHFRDMIKLDRDDVYAVEVDAIPAKTQFRPESRAAWPRIYGYENGVVDGPASSEYAQIDDHGRYNVKIKFDESSLKSGKASTFVRMMQPHGGGVEGFHFPLRKGTEVVMSFLGGDPDRPVISGVVPNALTPSPVTRGNYTKNVIQTGGRNRLELEDKAGAQRITMSTPYSNTYLRMGSPNAGHELILHTDDNTLLDFGKNFDLTVGHQGGGSWDVKVNDNWTTHVETGDYELGVDAGKSTTTVKGDTKLHVESGGLYTDVDTGVMQTKVKSDTSLQVTSGNYKADVDAGTATANIKGDTTVTVKSGNTKVDTLAGTTDILSKGKITVKSKSSDVDIEGDKVNTKSRSDWSWTILGTQVSFTAGSKVEFKLSQDTSFTLGLTNSFFVGVQNSFALAMQNSFVIGPQTSAFIGGKFGLTIAAELNLTAAAKLNFEVGINLTVGATADIKLVPTKLEQKMVKLEQAAAAHIKINGFTVII